MQRVLHIFTLILALWISIDAISQTTGPSIKFHLESNIYNSISKTEKELIDSSLVNFNNADEDTSKLKHLVHIIEKSLSDDVWTFYNEKLHAIVKNKLNEENSAQEHRFYTIILAETLNNFGVDYNAKGSVKMAISFHQKSLKIRERINYKPGIANSLANIGRVHLWQGNLDVALNFFNKSQAIFLDLRDSLNIAKSYNYIGYIAKLNGNNLQALGYYEKSLAIRRQINNKNGVAQSLTYIGEVFEDAGQLDSALLYYQNGLLIDYEIGEKNGAAIGLISVGRVNLKLGKIDKALANVSRSLAIAEEIGYPGHVKDATDILTDIYIKKGDWKNALNMYQKHVKMRDSLENRENEKALIKQELEYNYDKKNLADSLKILEINKINKLKIENRDATISSHRTQLYASIGGILMLIVLSFFIYKNLRTQKSANQIIQEQKQHVEEKNKQITDSITYAKRIQSAILPTKALIKENLNNSFVLYKPKDIVAGDFYWLEKKNDSLLFAVADCTGHGVPGAMVSVICNNGLNRSVREHGLTKPGEILDKTREIVIQEFEKSKDEVKDGMDIALCSLNGNILEFAGANNPLWLIRKSDYGDASIEILETKGNKQPIGKFDNLLPYTTHTLKLNDGDTFYLFSDGFPDQFGGEKGKKYKSGNFKKFLLSIQDKSMDEQLTLITIEFDKWKKGVEQVDDVCVMGVRI